MGIYFDTEENGGFYIARYEASYQDEKVVSKVSTSTRASDSILLINEILWNYAVFNDALLKLKNMYTSSEYISLLLIEIAWDRTLNRAAFKSEHKKFNKKFPKTLAI